MSRKTDDQFFFNSAKPAPVDFDWRKIKFAGLGLVGLAIIIIAGYWLWIWYANQPKSKPVVVVSPVATSSLGGLADKLSANQQAASSSLAKDEEMAFGDFYVKPIMANDIKAKEIKLPINIKQDTANYYYLNREIVLTADQLKHINANGFVVIDNPYAKEAKDFYGMYALLNKKSLPFLVTSDFLFYYYQNTVKSIFKQLESDSFYQSAWEFNKTMFDLANQRYLNRYAKVGLANDAVLEAMRQEAAYFAVALELLKVKPNQVAPDSQESVQVKEWLKLKFNSREADYYKFTVPDYLQLDVGREATLINSAKDKATLSPVMLYTRDYREFALPAEYDKNFRLQNFYLALTWSKTLFPLYYQSPDCPACLLDKSDWLINQATANLIARDLAANQDLKNHWAKIYKVYSYFYGLAGDLTYLDYNDEFVKIFGLTTEKQEGSQAGLTIEQIFDTANVKRDEQLTAWQQALAGRKFDPAKGGLDRSAAAGRAASGLRLTQRAYWPTQYIFDQLTFDRAGAYLGDAKRIANNDPAVCGVGDGVVTRCRAIGLDIINPIYNERIVNDYFRRNTAFKNYGNQAPFLRRHFDSFDNRQWNESFFWSNLRVAREFLNSRQMANFNYTKTDEWSNAVLNTALGSMINSNLPYDQWKYVFQQNRGLVGQEIIKYNYIEPNLALVGELSASGKMLFDGLVKLGLITANNQEFTDLLAGLDGVKNLIIKERNGLETDYNDWSFINGFVNKYYVTTAGDKTRDISFVDNKNGAKIYKMRQSLADVKLLISVQYHQGRNLIVVGPVFNYNEQAR